MANKATDLVISYTVHGNGKMANYEELQKALEDGYRVVDVLPIPNSVGGGGSNTGGAVVTVVLTKEGGSCVYRGSK